ncbi:putative non-specific serine/threonine protein kinase [Helianthus annuus]|uniref:Non-specific serine/threonine protein kinase n=1 Tax=Helianthus annuus TaxID=4232 RepID=A0A9K3E3J5_HELAN|nr:putative non-specific serine/threonine protein kinase [Helianthus annuus]KAJ0451935.1 putative non-specific serine/threonine protein kinase [Helianthus annuus]KAJ0456659.1 putative non-specific serine/threonine protein kinase [Helianthus annuus]KAJ0473819.1 putative non-specific serine/threonine protein kinase [Helianthus annuus]KAJ0649394.1 putative non-specific serine/threonine protein kinase [Helianthus annuus]
MVSSRGCFLMFQFLHSLLCISSVSFPDTSKPPVGNHDCSCLGNNLGPIDASSTPKSRKQEALTSVILILIMLNIIIYKLRELHETSLGKNKKPPSLSTEHLCRRFLLSEMQLATNSFDQSMIIGKGGFGKVYRGVIDDGGNQAFGF